MKQKKTKQNTVQRLHFYSIEKSMCIKNTASFVLEKKAVSAFNNTAFSLS